MSFYKKFKIAGLIIFSSFIISSHLWAQQGNSVPSSVSSAPPPAAESLAPIVIRTTTPTSEGLVSLDFQDADIKNVLKVLAYKSNMNIVAGPEVTGTVSIQLNDVPWQKALEVVLSTYGYSYE